MKPVAVMLSILVLVSWCPAQTAAAPDQSPRPEIVEDYSNPLPAYLTPEERLLPAPQVPPGWRSPPTGTVYCPPEYVACDGLFIAWEGYTSILTELAVKITINDPNVTVYVVVDNTSEQTTVYNTLSAAGARMDQIAFIVRVTDTVWIRDYGPRFIFEDGNLAIIDHTYNRPRPNDDAFNDYLASLWGIAQYDIPLVHGGGNFHLFDNGDAFMTTLILNENPGLTEQDVKDLYQQYQNLNLTIYPAFPSSFDSTQHIDMWMLPLGDYKVIIGQYSPSAGQPYTITEAAVADLTARGYTVYRTPGWRTSGVHYTYTNAVILNNQCFISKFGGSYTSQDAQALAVYQSALPGYTIHQIDCSGIISAAGALHCIVMHKPAAAPDPIPHVTVQSPNGGELWIAGQMHNITWTATDDVGVTSVDIYLSTDGGASFPHTVATGLANTGTYGWPVPVLNSNQCRIKVVAHDGDGNAGEDVSDANFTISLYGPQVIYSFPLDGDPGWTVQGQWAFGHPTGQGGTQHGYPDPSNGATGVNVYGVNLNGDYSTTPGGPYYLTTGPIDLRNATHTKLNFKRWLNSDYKPYVTNTIQVSNNGSNWTQVWTNGSTVITENAWSTQEYDISAVADGQPTIYIRWSYQVANGAYAYSGWNIDDIQIIGIPQVLRGDVNCDGTVGFGDINAFVLLMTNPSAWQDQYPGCPLANGDINEDGSVGFADINPFVALLTS